MSEVNKLRPPSEEYSDDVLYGSRREATKLLELIKLGNESECAIFGLGTFVNKRNQWGIKQLKGLDKRIQSMLDKLQIVHAFPLQRLCWPQLHDSKFPFLTISPQCSGKTYAYLLYVVSRCITRIPIAKTEQTIMSPDQLGSFKIDQPVNPLKNIDLTTINQDEFDFDSLGQIDKIHTTVEDNKSILPNGIEDKKNGEINGWNLQSEEHYEVNPDDFITHPKYIIICSSQQQVDLINHEIDSMKMAAFGDRVASMNRENIPPIVRTVSIHHTEEKLALRCNDSEILVATPAAIVRCLKLDFLTFTKCEKVIFDDLDITLQLHNSTVRELIKHYLLETEFDESNQENSDPGKKCQVFMFSRKWTILLQQFVSSIFLQRTLIFGSIIEASLYANLKYELEFPHDMNSKLRKLSDLVLYHTARKGDGIKMAIVCNSNMEASKLSKELTDRGFGVLFVDDNDPMKNLNSTSSFNSRITSPQIYTLCDSAVEQVVDFTNDITHLIHFSLPEDLLILDQRFRLMYKNIVNLQKNLVSIMFMSDKVSTRYAKELYDVISRSNSTLNSTRLQLRDFISERSSSYCWRWASTGVCRLEKLSREDKFGSYCSGKHSLTINDNDCVSELPRHGQVKITITNLVSPNEFYFRFEAHRDKNSIDKKWTQLENTGRKFMKTFQSKLDALKDTQNCSIPLAKISKGIIYGIYSHEEARVDRIILLDELKRDDGNETKAVKKNGMLNRLDQVRYQLEYSKQCEATKIDYGININVYLRNIFELPQSLASIKPQCHRGFHLGVKPTDGEPNWLYKAKKFFYDQVCVSDLYETTAWLRLNSNNCFWFENMIVKRRLSNIDENRIFLIEPHKDLHKAGLAELTSSEPSCLHRSERLETLSIWQVNECVDYIQYAFLRKDKEVLDVYVLHILYNLDVKVRNEDYNKQLIELEDRITEECKNNLVEPLNHFAVGTYCIARVDIPDGEPTYNRCKIISSPIWDDQTTEDEIEFCVDCLDHGDEYKHAKKRDLFLASPDHFSQLPFQSMTCKLANLNYDLLQDAATKNKVINAMYDFTRDENDQLIPLKCELNEEGHITLYAPERGAHLSMVEFMKKRYGLEIFI